MIVMELHSRYDIAEGVTPTEEEQKTRLVIPLVVDLLEDGQRTYLDLVPRPSSLQLAVHS